MSTNYHTAFSNAAPKTAFTKAAMGAPLSELDRAITYQQGKIIVTCDGAVTWTSGVLTWSGTIHIYFTSAAGLAIHNSIAAGNLSVTDAYYAYVTLNETNDTVLTAAQAVITPASASTFFTYNRLVLGYRNAANDMFYPLGLSACMGVAANVLTYKGTTNCSGNPNYPAGNAGDVYFVSVAGKIGGASGTAVEVGDIYICNTDNTTTGDQAAKGAYWNLVQGNFNLTDYFAKAGTGEIAALTEKTTPVDDDVVMIDDSASTPTANVKKRLSWANIKATLKAYFDALYSQLTGTAEGSFLVTGASPFSFGEKTLVDTKALLLVGQAGATLPATAVHGDMFLHTPTGRSVLMQYITDTWYPIMSYGTMTMYVDGTDGEDSASKGTSTGSDAFKTIQYAVNQIPPSYGGNVVINVTAGTYAKDVVVRGKAPTGDYTITIQGTLSAYETITSCTPVVGTGLQRATITKASAFNKAVADYTNKLAYFVTDAIYRVIDGHASVISFNSGGTNPIAVGDIIKGVTSGAYADVLEVNLASGSWAGGDAAGTLVILVTFGTWQNGEVIYNITDSSADDGTTASTAADSTHTIVIVGAAASTTSQSVIIYDWATNIKSFSNYSVATVTGCKISNSANRCVLHYAELTLNRCSIIAQSTYAGFQPWATLNLNDSYVYSPSQSGTANGRVNIYRSKLKIDSGTYNIRMIGVVGFTISAGTIIEGGTRGLSVEQGCNGSLYSAAATHYCRIRNCTNGITASGGGQVSNALTNIGYSNNTTNTNATAASFGYIG